MAKDRKKIIQENIGSILEYQSVLNSILKRKVTLDSAMADWYENVYLKKAKTKSYF